MEKDIKPPEIMFKDNEISRAAYVTYIWFLNKTEELDRNKPQLFNRKLFKEQGQFSSDTTIYKAIKELVKIGLFKPSTEISHYTIVIPIKAKVTIRRPKVTLQGEVLKYTDSIKSEYSTEELLLLSKGFQDGLIYGLDLCNTDEY